MLYEEGEFDISDLECVVQDIKDEFRFSWTNKQASKWQKLKEYLKNQIVDLRHIDIKTEIQNLRVNDGVNCFKQILNKMQKLEVEDESI